MLCKTRAIVVRCTKYKEKDVILHAYTEEFGMISYMVYNPWGKKTKVKAALIQAFSILELDVEHQPKKDIQRIKDARILFLGTSIHTNPYKQSIVFFLAEMIQKSLSETEKEPHLFTFLLESISALENSKENFSSFHLIFLMQLSNFLGFFPNNDTDNSLPYFDMLNGIFTEQQPLHEHHLKGTDSAHFWSLSHIHFADMAQWIVPRTEKQSLLHHIVRYYQLHIPTIRTVKSLDVLHTLYN